MDQPFPIVSDEHNRLVELLREALLLADGLGCHFVAAKIDLALASFTGEQDLASYPGGD